MRPALAVPASTAVAGLAVLGYAAGIERNAFRLRRYDVPALAAGSAPLRVLHLSDVHMRADQRRKQAWVRALADEEPDLVLTTGDNLGGADAVPAMLGALEPLARFPGAFVLGSNDYYSPRPKNPLRYFVKSQKRVHGDENPWPELVRGLREMGWADLTNRRTTMTVAGRLIALAGVDDPHIRRDRPDAVAGAPGPGAELGLALAHSPEPRVLDRFAADGWAVLLSGHTHGGQLRLPGYGALVTNCGIDRERCRGLSRYDGAWLHVSAGLGTSPYAPVRFACPPEASLLTLVAQTP